MLSRMQVLPMIAMLVAIFALELNAETLRRRLTHDEMRRQYLLFVPDNLSPNQPTPLVINMHGGNLTASDQMSYSEMNAVAEQNEFIVAYPDAINKLWNHELSANQADDIGFLNAMIDSVANDYDIDLQRVYSTGMSQGAIMSYVLAVKSPLRIAAIAPVAAVMPIQVPVWDQHPSRPIPLMHIHGTADTITPYNGGRFPFPPPEIDTPPVEDSVQSWASANGCDAAPTTTLLPDINTHDRTTVEVWEYFGCESNENGEPAEVLLYKVINGGHTWPGTDNFPGLNLGATNHDFDGSTEIWEFFSRHSLSTPSVFCDVNRDSLCDVGDINSLSAVVRDGVFTDSFDLNNDGTVDKDDRVVWVRSIPTWFGDSDLDGEFDSGDLVQVFQAGHYEDEIPLNSGWEDGDWNGDGDFDSGDLVFAFQDGGYEKGPRDAAQVVPEPSAAMLIAIAMIGFLRK